MEYVIITQCQTILKKHLEKISIILKIFKNYAKKHTCDVRGCGNCLVLDGHMKAHRKICKRSGCKNDPETWSLFCKEHSIKCCFNSNIINGKQSLQEKDAYHVEEIRARKFNKFTRSFDYKVKWLNYDDETWEPFTNMPRVLIEIFNRFGSIKSDVFIVNKKHLMA